MTFPTNTNYSNAMRPRSIPRITQGGMPGTAMRNPRFQSTSVQAEEKRQQKIEKEQAAHNTEDPSIWRDTALRYGGYTDEVGEFLTPYTGSVGKFIGYGISSAYVLADMATSLPQRYMGASPEFGAGKKSLKTAEEALDLGLFHYVATLWIPPMLIGTVVEATSKLLDSKAQIHPPDDKIKSTLTKGADLMVNPLKDKTQAGVDGLLQRTHGFVKKNIKPSADRWIQNNNQSLGNFVDKVALVAEQGQKIPGLKKLIDSETLRANAKAIATKTKFEVDELARLLFIKPLPVAIGIGMVPLIAHPFDELMIKFQNWTIRPLLGKNKIVKDENGNQKSVKNPAFWGHEKQPVGHATAKPTPHAKPMNVPATLNRHQQAAHPKAHFGYVSPLPRLLPNPMTSLTSNPIYREPLAYPAAINQFSRPVKPIRPMRPYPGSRPLPASRMPQPLSSAFPTGMP